MGDVVAKGTHYMTFPHTLAGRTRDQFTIKLFKDGELKTDIPFDVREVSSKIYTISFANDGTDYSIWTLVVSDPLVVNIYYVETWEVRKNTLEKNIKQIRSRQDSEGGFFKGGN